MTDSSPPADLGEAIGRAIRARRAERGLTLRELSDLTGISYSYLAEIERGTSGKRVASGRLFEIARALGMSPSQLIGWGEQLRDGSTTDDDTVCSPWPCKSRPRPPPPGAMAGSATSERDARYSALRSETTPPSERPRERHRPREPEGSSDAARDSAWDVARDEVSDYDGQDLRQHVARLIEYLETDDLVIVERLARSLLERAEIRRRRSSRRQRRD